MASRRRSQAPVPLQGRARRGALERRAADAETEIAQLIDVSLGHDPGLCGTKVELRSTNNDKDAATRARQEEKMEQREQQEPQEHAVEQHDDESRALPQADLRVEERVEVASSDSLARVFEQRGFFENGVAQSAGTNTAASPGPAAPCSTPSTRSAPRASVWATTRGGSTPY